MRRKEVSTPMFSKSRKDTLVEQAQGLAQDLAEAIAPHVERARDEIAPRLTDARDTIAPKLADARDTIAPKLADARDTVAPHVENARDRFVKDVVPAVQSALEDARDHAAPVAEEARRRGSLAAAALKGEPVQQKGSKKKTFLFLAVLAGAGAFVAKKVSGSGESANWQSSYTPTPAPPAPPAPPSPAAPMAGSHIADAPGAAAGAADTDALGGDAGGAAPGESLSDAAEEPHPVTTPDSPAEDVDVSGKDDPKV